MSFRVNGRTLLVCNCERTMDIDGGKLAAGLGAAAGGEGELTVHSHLCRAQIESFRNALAPGEPLLVACTQEAPLFREVAQESGGADIAFTNIRERAGWSQARTAALPKMAALIAEAGYVSRPAGSIPIVSQGVCLVYGAGQAALETAAHLATRLNVSVMLTDASDAMPPSVVDVPIYKGRIVRAAGALGNFEVTVNGYAPAVPSSRDALQFVMERDGAASSCDLIFDMSDGDPLFPEPERRDGYFRVDPNHPAAVARAMFEISDMVGEFDKPLYVAYDAEICAHARSGKVGCTNCLDACPVSAIAPDGERIAVDAHVCGGCGNCHSVCPTGAISYAYPRREDLIGRLQALLGAYTTAGGRDPVLLVHDERHGAGLLSAMARYGRGLPANVLPFSVYAVTALGHDLMLAALAAGAQRIVILASPERSGELAALEAQAALADAFMAGLGHGEAPRVRVTVEADPDAVEASLYAPEKLNGLTPIAFSAVGGKRDIARNVIGRLHDAAPDRPEVLALPAGAPYGRIAIDTAGCTLCLACVGACPVNALGDNPERPQVRFTEAACVQCGICKATCPEGVITLEMRYNFSSAALSPAILYEEEPFACVRCGKPFGSRKSIDRVIAQLKGTHWMFQDERRLNVLQMCDDCRITTVAEEDNPFAAAERPRVRTTDDYLKAEELARQTGKTPDDFLN